MHGIKTRTDSDGSTVLIAAHSEKKAVIAKVPLSGDTAGHPRSARQPPVFRCDIEAGSVPRAVVASEPIDRRIRYIEGVGFGV